MAAIISIGFFLFLCGQPSFPGMVWSIEWPLIHLSLEEVIELAGHIVWMEVDD
jgi:hypothetical protein